MHFTDTLDYVIVTHGTLTLELHDGTTRDVGAGEVVIQLANVHAWHNRTDGWGRESLAQNVKGR